MKDTTFGNMVLTESRDVSKSDYADQGYGWYTRGGLLAALNAWDSEEGKKYAEKLITCAKASKKHPDFPKDRNAAQLSMARTMCCP